MQLWGKWMGGLQEKGKLIKCETISLLGKVLKDSKALEQLKVTRDLNAAYRASDLVFKERQEAAIKSVESDILTLAQLTIRPDQLPDLETSLGRLQGIVDRTRGSGLKGVEQTHVFHDRIDHHFTSIKVNSYKQLDGLELRKLSRVNLIAGLNNTGKTSLLEAIYLLTKQNDFAGILEVIRRRGKVAEDHINPEWLVRELVSKSEIAGSFDEEEDKKVEPEHKDKKDRAYLTLFNIFERFPHLTNDVDLSILTKFTRKSYRIKWNCFY